MPKARSGGAGQPSERGKTKLDTGVELVDRFSDRGRKRIEHHLPELLKDIKTIVDPVSQADPTFRSKRLYSPLTAREIHRRLPIEKGYKASELPTVRTISNKLKDLGVHPQRVILHPQSRGASGSPPRGGRSLWESPKGGCYDLFKIQIQLLFFQPLPVHEYTCVWFLHPNQLCSHSIRGDQKCLPFVCLLSCKCRWIRTALLPFKKPITNAMLNFGGTLRHMWDMVRSQIALPINSIPRCRQRSFIISPTLALKFPVQFPFPILWNNDHMVFAIPTNVR